MSPAFRFAAALARSCLTERCPSCAGRTEAGFCAGCRADLPAIVDACSACGLPRPVRRCPRAAAPWHVSRVIAPFEYAPPIDGFLQALKFGHGRMLGRALALLVVPSVRPGHPGHPGGPSDDPAEGLSDVDNTSRLLKKAQAARCGVENRLEMLTYSHVRCAFEPVFALHHIHPSLFQQPASRPELLVPVPLHRRRLVARGYNQATEIARTLSAALSIPLAPAAAARVQAAAPQSRLGARARRANVAHAFEVRGDVAGRRVAIVDDVITTGATVNALAEALLRAGAARVEAWAVARTSRAPPGRRA